MDTTDSSDGAEIHGLEERRCRAVIDADIATLDGLLDDGFVFTHSNGHRDTKATFVEALKSGKFDYRVLDRPEEKVTVWGDAAIMLGQFEIDILISGRAKHISSFFLGVWRRRDGRWRMVALQSSGVPPAP